MATNNENIIYDETRLENDEPNATVNNPVAANEPAQAQREKNEKSGSSVRQNVAAGAVGAAAGIAGMMAISSFSLPEEPVENPAPNLQPIPEPEHFDGTAVSVAHSVNDDMNFSEAFATARQEIGAGGVFQWHGGVYGTYYANEWQGFSDEYRQSFSNYPYSIVPEPLHADAGTVDDPHEDFPLTPPESDDLAANSETPATGGDAVIINAENIVIVGQEVTVVSAAEVDGFNTAVVDTDHDDSYNITVLDEYGNPETLPEDDSVTDDSYAMTVLDEYGNPEPLPEDDIVLLPEDNPVTDDSYNITVLDEYGNPEEIPADDIVPVDDSYEMTVLDEYGNPEEIPADDIVPVDDSYEMTVLDEYGNPEEIPADDFDHADLSDDGSMDLFDHDTPADYDDASNFTPASDLSADFNNHADISNFV